MFYGCTLMINFVLSVVHDIPFSLADSPWVWVAALKQLSTWYLLACTAFFAALRFLVVAFAFYNGVEDPRYAGVAWVRLTRASGALASRDSTLTRLPQRRLVRACVNHWRR